jgi:hypothetical protein
MKTLEERAALAAGYEVKTIKGELWAKRPGHFTRFERFHPCNDMHQCGQLLLDYRAKQEGTTPFAVLNSVVCEVANGTI